MTGRYDMKAVKLRIALEEWCDVQLKALWGFGPDDSPDPDPIPEIDLDEVKDMDHDEQANHITVRTGTFVGALLVSAPTIAWKIGFKLLLQNVVPATSTVL